MARYAPEWLDHIRRPRPTSHIREPQGSHRPSPHRNSRPDDRDRDRSRIGDGAVEVRIVNGIIEDHPDHPININFNYGPVHVHQPCPCPDHSPHTCVPRRNTLPPYPYSPAGGEGGDRRRTGPPPPPPRQPPRPSGGAGAGSNPHLRSILRPPRSPSPTAPRTSTPRAVIVSPSPDSSDWDSSDDDPPVRGGGGGAGGGGRTMTTTTTTTTRIGICDGCLTRQRLVLDRYCAECEYFADGPEGTGGFSRSARGSGPRPTGGFGGSGGGGGGGGVRYVSSGREDAAAEAVLARREARARWREIELEARDREMRERERERERDALGGRDAFGEGRRGLRGVRWVREVDGRDRDVVRERRYYPGTASEAYYSDSEGDSGW